MEGHQRRDECAPCVLRVTHRTCNIIPDSSFHDVKLLSRVTRELHAMLPQP